MPTPEDGGYVDISRKGKPSVPRLPGMRGDYPRPRHEERPEQFGQEANPRSRFLMKNYR